MNILNDKCQIPPPGWECTRDAGHEGPCAAIPDEETSSTPLTDAIDAECDEHENYPRGPYQMLCRRLERALAEKDAKIAEQAAQIVALRDVCNVAHKTPRGESLSDHALECLEQALSTPAPPVVPLEDVRPLVEAAKTLKAAKGRHNTGIAYERFLEATNQFLTKHPQP